jgi:hypothetical protein
MALLQNDKNTNTCTYAILELIEPIFRKLIRHGEWQYANLRAATVLS